MKNSIVVSLSAIGAISLATLASRSAGSARQGTALVRLQASTPGAAQTGHGNISGTFIAGQLQGSGSGITTLNAGNITNGTLGDSRLSTNVAKLNNGQTFTGAKSFTNSANSFVGNGGGLFGLNASNITTGTLADARLSANVALLNANQTFTGANTFSNAANAFTGNGAGLTALNATNITTGTLADPRLSTKVVRTDKSNAFENFTNTFLGTVGIGSIFPTAKLHVEAQPSVLVAVYGHAIDNGASIGGQFLSNGDSGIGVQGYAINTGGSTVGVWGQTNSPAGRAVCGDAGFTDTGMTYGGYFETKSTSGHGAYGEATAGTGVTQGLHGKSKSDTEPAAGVKAEGNGVNGAGAPAAAALEINNGAITVSGGTRPAGTIVTPPAWICMSSWLNTPGVPDHCHPIGAYQDLMLVNDLIKPDSVILLTVRDFPPAPGKACFVQVLDQMAGSAFIRVAVMGSTQCRWPCDYTGPVRVHYLIVNPL